MRTWLTCLGCGLILAACEVEGLSSSEAFPPCASDADCATGFGCVANVCAPACQMLDLLAYVESSTKESNGIDFLTNRGEPLDEKSNRTAQDTGLAYLGLDLSPKHAVAIGPSAEPECAGWFLFRASLVRLAQEESSTYLDLSVVQGSYPEDYRVGRLPGWGLQEPGLNPDKLTERDFEASTRFWMINPKSFAWPRILLQSKEKPLALGLREFKLFCCLP